MSEIRKFLTAAAGAVVIIGDVYFADGVFFSESVEAGIVSLLTALAVYLIPNKPPTP